MSKSGRFAGALLAVAVVLAAAPPTRAAEQSRRILIIAGYSPYEEPVRREMESLGMVVEERGSVERERRASAGGEVPGAGGDEGRKPRVPFPGTGISAGGLIVIRERFNAHQGEEP